MINADANRGEAKSNGGDAARRSGAGPIGNEAIEWIGLVPEIIETGPLEVVEELIVISERARRGRNRLGWRALAGAAKGRGAIKPGLVIADREVAEARRAEQARGDCGKRSIGTGRAVNTVAGQVGFGISVPMQDDALISRAGDQAGRRDEGRGLQSRCQRRRLDEKRLQSQIWL